MANDILNKEEKLSFRERSKSEPEWLYANREKAWNHYINSPLPNRASHLWRYSNPNDFLSTIPDLISKENRNTDCRFWKYRWNI